MNNYVLQENKIRKNINPENFLRNAKQEFPCQSLENFSGEYYNMENKSSTSRLDLCVPTKLAQITVLEVSKMKQKSSATDGVDQNGATVKNVKKYQPVKNACAATKFGQLKHFIWNLKQGSPELKLFWKFLPWNLIV